ncbi:hypothetical protein AVEN_219548-1, partial [Araneus ventricosus]
GRILKAKTGYEWDKVEKLLEKCDGDAYHVDERGSEDERIGNDEENDPEDVVGGDICCA